MVLIYDGMYLDPRVNSLSSAGEVFWIAAIGLCNTKGRDTLAVDELREWVNEARPGRYDVDERLAELVAADLAQLLPHEHIKLLARMDLWSFDDDGEAA